MNVTRDEVEKAVVAVLCHYDLDCDNRYGCEIEEMAVSVYETLKQNKKRNTGGGNV